MEKRFSAYVFGGVMEDDVVLKVGYVLERLTKIGEQLNPILEPNIEIRKD